MRPPAPAASTGATRAGTAVAARRRSFASACACACRGLRFAARRQANLRAHLGIAGVVLVGGAAAGLTALELALLAAASGLVLSAELLNTSIEMLTDLVSPREDPRAAAVKDVSAGAVLLASATALALGAFVVLGRLWPRGPVADRAAAALGLACLAAFVIAARGSTAHD